MIRLFNRRSWLLPVAAAATWLAGCAGYGPGALKPGDPRAAAVQQMGEPTNRYVMPGGAERLEFARGPFGRHTYMVDVDVQGRVQQVEQVLDSLHFQRVVPGMSRDDLLRLIGRPAEARPGGLRGGQTWSWRYPTNDCLWFQVSLEDDGRVRDGGSYGIDPLCDKPSGPRD